MAPRKTKRRPSSRTRKPASRRGRMLPWYLLGSALIAAMLGREHLPAMHDWQALWRRGTETKTPVRTPVTTPQRIAAPTPDSRPSETAAAKPGPPASANPGAGGATFFYCGIRQDNCIIDGGNFIYRGEQIRVADIYVPATKEAKCDRERNLGGDAKEALRILLNAGEFELAAWKPIDEDQHGRKLRIVRRNGRSIGDALVAKGLARPWTGERQSWCP
ncbi:thermonuclease family protein [Mycoplana dimorpha]|uniref:Endonuclease YncB(Thermonuclease family) n=1 Tax=Mycoplana dimorpha TaxID=28320 RepID=A0A2T5BEE8_MYCDI|nr:thermonuclease family protein [Mycoplana dimorpha]PTM97352.1 endonuclease YncB(thermonuclease family) [Mycoplana dimorpha]